METVKTLDPAWTVNETVARLLPAQTLTKGGVADVSGTTD